MNTILFPSLLLLSATLGGIIGWQRHHMGKNAGFRTFSLVSFGSTLYTLISIHGFTEEPARVAAQILTGIGFIGAGIIMHKRDNTVDGLTTAASFWAMAAIGMAVGLGWIAQAVVATFIMFILLSFPDKQIFG